MKYKYRGSSEVVLKGYGIVNSGEVIDVELAINNPLFQPYVEQPGLPPREKKRKRSRK